MEETIRALLIDDDQGDFEMTRAMISEIRTQEISLDWVATYQEGLDALEGEEYDVYIVDYFLEDHTGMDLLLAARELGTRAPLIMLTGRGNRQVDIQAMNAGAADYLVKGRIGPELLERAIRFALERNRARQELRASGSRFNAVFEEAPVPIAVVDADGLIIDVNEAFERVFGQSRDRALTKPLVDLAAQGERAELVGAVQKLLDGELDRHAKQHRFLTSGGDEVRALTKVRPIGDVAGEASHLVFLFDPDPPEEDT